MKWIISSFEFSQPEEQEICTNSLIPINSLLSYVFKKKSKGFFISLTKKKMANIIFYGNNTYDFKKHVGKS